MDLRKFAERIASDCGLTFVPDPTADLRTDLGFDSIQMLDIVMAVEDLSGGVLQESELFHSRTLVDLYATYRSRQQTGS